MIHVNVLLGIGEWYQRNFDTDSIETKYEPNNHEPHRVNYSNQDYSSRLRRCLDRIKGLYRDCR